MQGTSYSFPTQLPTRCGAIWRRVLRALAGALDIQNLDGKFISASAAAGGRHDDRLHLRTCSTLPLTSFKQSLLMVLL